MDVFSPEDRSRVMAAIGQRDTRPELRLRKALHALGFRYRLNVRALPGTPDLVLPRWNAAVFVHGCFWHRHPGCRLATTPATRTGYWLPKFAANVARDARAVADLRAMGWRVATVWECGLGVRRTPETAAAVAGWLRGDDALLDVPEARAAPERAPARV